MFLYISLSSFSVKFIKTKSKNDQCLNSEIALFNLNAQSLIFLVPVTVDLGLNFQH